MGSTDKNTQYLRVELPTDIAYRYSAGPYLGKFFVELRDHGKIYSNKCPACPMVFTPPRVVCPRCHIRLAQWPDWQQSGPEGTILTFSVIKTPFRDPATARPKKVPYAVAGLRLDNGGMIEHFLEECDEKKIRIGMRVTAILKPLEQRLGSMLDIAFFRIIST